MGRSAANRQGIVIELSGKFTLSGGHPSKRISVYRCSAPVKRVWCQRFWFFLWTKLLYLNLCLHFPGCKCPLPLPGFVLQLTIQPTAVR